VQFCLRLIESAAAAENLVAFLRAELPEIASEFAAQWVGVVRRALDWDRLGEFGRLPIARLPQNLLTEALDRDAAGWISLDAGTNGGGWNFCAAPLKGGVNGELLVLCGRSLGQKSLPGVLAAAWALGWAV